MMRHGVTGTETYWEGLLSEAVRHSFMPALLLIGCKAKGCRSSSFLRKAENPEELGILACAHTSRTCVRNLTI